LDKPTPFSESPIMTRFPISEWQAEQFRLTAFPMPWSKERDQNWWKAVTGVAPEEINSNQKSEITQIAGPYNNGGLVLSYNPMRIDWVMAPVPPNINLSNPVIPNYPSLGNFQSTLAVFKPLMEKWLASENLPKIYRLAFGGVLSHPEENRESGYSHIKDYLPIDLRANEASDFFLQINFPINFESKHLNIKINRLSKWSVSKYDQTIFVPSISFHTNSSKFGLRIELDINTTPEHQEPIEPLILIPLLQELINQSVKIPELGANPR
jgi:hypothetical protein